MPSPYEGLPAEQWEAKTHELIAQHPLDPAEIVEVVLKSWDAIFSSNLGGHHIGRDIFPGAQIMGFFLHELIALELGKRYPGVWRGDKATTEKDLVYLPDLELSVEMKSSTHRSQIFGNRSYAQPPNEAAKGKKPKKSKNGYYTAINFEKFTATKTAPKVLRVRFGWLDHTDWVGQKAQTGQQAHIKPESDRAKLLLIYDVAMGAVPRGLPAEPIDDGQGGEDADCECPDDADD